MKFWRLLLAWLVLLLGSGAAQAQLAGMEIHVPAALEAETLSPAAGSTVTLAITMRPEAGWHGYWSNPGDAGEGLSLEWSLPEGASVGTPRFPVPETLVISGFMNYVFKDPHAILIDLKLPRGLSAGTRLPVSVEAYWLACTDRVCVPQQDRLTLDLAIGDGAVTAANRKRFDAWRAALPVPLDQQGRFAVNGKRVSLAIPYPASAPLSAPYFFPAASGVIDHMAAQEVRRSGDWLVVSTQLAPSGQSSAPSRIEGLLRIGEDEGLLVTVVPGDVPKGGALVGGDGDAQSNNTPPLLWLLLGALAGGILLNVMPCVFPILGLKALALAKGGGDERKARKDALAYAAGVVLSCLALGAIMLLLRAGGEEVGWAFQLQEPGFVLFLFLVMVGVTANLLGWFSLSGFGAGDALTRQAGVAGSFWTGVLAALVATPCTGPFMAAALGAALLLPAAEALALFAMLGVGIALPFLAIAFVPALRSLLPRPGLWLQTFRKAMAVPMGLTALALLWLLWRQAGMWGLSIGVGAALIMLLLLWERRKFPPRWASFSLTIVIAALSVFVLARDGLPDETVDQRQVQSILPSEAFSETRLAALRAEGRPVFVYFTADWCVTCKVNEAAVLEREETARLFERKGIAILRGDFTRRSPEIARFLSAQGAAGVPLYLYYPKGAESRQLPQILTGAILSDAIDS